MRQPGRRRSFSPFHITIDSHPLLRKRVGVHWTEILVHQTRILIADDSRTIRTVLRRILAAAEYEVLAASDGAEAVEIFRQENPSLVILDIQMPEMDGYSACEEILALTSPDVELPIIFLTKDRANHLATLGKQLGAYLQKPVCEQTLLHTVRELLNRRSLSQAC